MAAAVDASAADASADLEHVRGALRRSYNIEAAELVLLDAGSTPNHYVKTASGSEFLAKALRSRLGAWVADGALQQAGLMAHVAAGGLSTPAVLPVITGGGSAAESGAAASTAARGAPYVAILPGPLEGEQTHLIVLEWAVGYQRADHLLAASPALGGDILSMLGSQLALLHSFPLPDGVSVPKPDAPGGHSLCDMGTFLECASDPSKLYPGVDSDDARWFRSWLPKLVDLWARMPEPTVLCHGDAYLDNVLARPSADGSGADGLALMLIDWEDSCLTNPVVDLSACAVGTCFVLSLGEGSEDVAVELLKDRFAALVKGYESRRQLSSQERALLLPTMQACAWACGAFRYGRFLDGVTDLKTRKYGQLIEVVKILEDLGTGFDALLA
eukprot:TRINITY_DN37571_c0_g1_i1.p1 TRINITY_DN37571_c0_g1~~TRINITY_DN37571_c0_g1_i1.p1  ORF type:complete len:404 (-),score=97.63 TRINITY_DN37571_c0_g1_i1:75-1235(-)